MKAAELLSKNGITPETPWKVTFTYVARAPLENDLWTLVQEDLAAVGVELDPQRDRLRGLDGARRTKGAADELVNFALSYNGIEVQLGELAHR